MMPTVDPANCRPMPIDGTLPALLAASTRDTPRPTSIISPMASSLTADTQLRLALVTSTPCALAASTSMLRMSIATRDTDTRPGSAANSSAGQAVARSATMIWQDRAAAISAGVSSGSCPSCSTTSPSARSPESARAP